MRNGRKPESVHQYCVKRLPPKHPEGSFVYMIFPAQTFFWPGEDLDCSELRATLVSTFVPLNNQKKEKIRETSLFGGEGGQICCNFLDIWVFLFCRSPFWGGRPICYREGRFATIFWMSGSFSAVDLLLWGRADLLQFFWISGFFSSVDGQGLF